MRRVCQTAVLSCFLGVGLGFLPASLPSRFPLPKRGPSLVRRQASRTTDPEIRAFEHFPEPHDPKDRARTDGTVPRNDGRRNDGHLQPRSTGPDGRRTSRPMGHRFDRTRRKTKHNEWKVAPKTGKTKQTRNTKEWRPSPLGPTGWIVVVQERIPETVTIFHDNHEVLHTLANTGVAGARTPPGAYRIDEKLAFQVMRGTFPNGLRYAVPVHDIWYFHGGDALHGYPRAAYGFPQSNGCVEIPPQAALRLFPMLPVGAEVEVIGPLQKP